MAATIMTEVAWLRASRLTTTTGRVPACSEPSTGSSLARKTSPRRTSESYIGTCFEVPLFFAERFPIAYREIVRYLLRFPLVFGVLGHVGKCGINLLSAARFHVTSDSRNHQVIQGWPSALLLDHGLELLVKRQRQTERGSSGFW